MAVSDVIRLGDKIDIRLIQQVENADKTGTSAETYRSQVLDIRENGNFEISMPTEKGKLILLPLGVRFEFVFYSYTGSLYRCMGQVVERYKKDGFYLLEIQLKTPLEKFQRREYYRYSCTMDFSFYALDDEHQEMETAEEIYQNLTEGEVKVPPYHGMMVDLSGGGMKFRSPYEFAKGDRLLINLHLTNERMDRHFQVLANVISSIEVHTPTKALFESRISFIIEDNRIREEIIRYIFEEERKIRQKENG